MCIKKTRLYQARKCRIVMVTADTCELQNKQGGKALCVYFVHFVALSVCFPYPYGGNARGGICFSNQGSFR